MSIQLKDSITLIQKNGDIVEYDLLSVENGILFNPYEYGFIPQKDFFVSICMKGYLAKYIISESEIILDELSISVDPSVHIVLNSIEPEIRKESFDIKNIERPFNTNYRNVNLKISEFTGTIIMGKPKEEPELIMFACDDLDYWKSYYDKVVEVKYDRGTIIEFRNL